MKILVTGAAGFIGFHLVQALVKRGDEVVGIDNINDYYDVNLKYDRLKALGVDRISIKENDRTQSQVYSGFYFMKMDIINLGDMKKLFEEENFQQVIHLAAQAGVRYSLENPHAYIQSNVVGYVNLLECCREHKIQHLVYASSSSVYGMANKVPFSESDSVDQPVSLYAATKKSNELMAHSYSHLFQLPTTGLRFFTVYGPWGRPDMAPMLFASAISENCPIKVFNHGEMERDFTYIDDVITGIISSLDNSPTQEDERPFYRLFNIGNSQPVQLMDFIQKLQEAMGKKAQLDFQPMQAGDVKRTYADTTKLFEQVGYRPKTSIEEGVKKFADWYSDYMKH